MNEARKDEAIEFYPLPINILKLQYYSSFFDLSEIALFNWVVVKATAFKYQQYFYSLRRISEEVRIKEDRLKTIIKRFEDLGIIEVEIKGMPRQHYFTVDFAQIITLIPKIYQFTENSEQLPENSKLLAEKSKLLTFFSKLLTESSAQKKYNKKDQKKFKNEMKEEKEVFAVDKKSTGNIENTNEVIVSSNRGVARDALSELRERMHVIRNVENTLKNVFKERIKLYNEKIEDRREHYRISKLSLEKIDRNVWYALNQDFDLSEIISSFSYFIDEAVKSGMRYSKLIPTFIKRTKSNGFETVKKYCV